MRILMLASDAHGGFGGIALYNRNLLDALASRDDIGEILVLPRIVSEPGFTPPQKVRYDPWSTAGRAAFLRRSAVNAMTGEIDLVYCAHINLLPVAAPLARLRRIPLVLGIHGIDAWRPPANPLAARLARACRHVFSVSRLTLDRFRAWAGNGQATVAVLPNAVRGEDFGLGPKPPDLVERYRLAGRKTVMTFGRMSPEERYKGFDEVIEALPGLRTAAPTVTYLAVGDGADRPRLQAKAAELAVADRVVFAGRIPEDRKADHYRLADAYVMPSRGEGFGFVVLEALASGLPVVASTADGTREALMGGALGRLVDPGDAPGLRRAILEALGRPKAIPPGLEHFSFDNFRRRLHAALDCVFLAV